MPRRTAAATAIVRDAAALAGLEAGSTATTAAGTLLTRPALPIATTGLPGNAATSAALGSGRADAAALATDRPTGTLSATATADIETLALAAPFPLRTAAAPIPTGGARAAVEVAVGVAAAAEGAAGWSRLGRGGLGDKEATERGTDADEGTTASGATGEAAGQGIEAGGLHRHRSRVQGQDWFVAYAS